MMQSAMSILLLILVVGLSLGNPKYALIETEDVTGFDAGFEEPVKPIADKNKPVKSARNYTLDGEMFTDYWALRWCYFDSCPGACPFCPYSCCLALGLPTGRDWGKK